MFEPARLLDSLNYYGVHFLVGESYPGFAQPLSPDQVLAGLAVQPDARMRLALIAVLLLHPEFSVHKDDVLVLLPVEQHTIFQLYYTAACYLQLAYFDRLRMLLGPFEELPDFFSNQLGIPAGLRTNDQLKELAHQHQEITGLGLNWYGTYQHAARRVIARLEREQEWATA